MFPDVAEERDDVKVSCPLQVVDDKTGVVASGIHETRHLPTDALQPFLDGRGVVQGSFLGTPRGIPDGTGRSAENRNGSMSGQLEPPQHQERHEVADLQAGRGWIEAGVDRLRTARQVTGQP